MKRNNGDESLVSDGCAREHACSKASCRKWRLTAVDGATNDAKGHAGDSGIGVRHRGIKCALDFVAVQLAFHIVCTNLENKDNKYSEVQ